MRIVHRTLAIAFLFAFLAPASDVLADSQPVLLQMIRDDSVHEELNLTPDQIDQLMVTLAKVDPPWFRSRNLPTEQLPIELNRLTGELRSDLQTILTTDQLERVHQLERQALGTRMFLNDDVIKRLDIKPGIVSRLRETFTDTDAEAAKLQAKVNANEMPAGEANRKIEKLKAGEKSKVIATLTDKQTQQLGSLTGKSFSFGQVKRMYPLAPPLETTGVKWIQNGPQSMEELRGKVVAVHFYAFQCINCQRNFPHYQGWHTDYADDGLVIIGIQTPETSSERDFDRVAAAAMKNGFEYPVMLDGDSTNWKAYSNTMWPTVYLIDKKGFLRRWWQGELNWKGATGEQQLRETIEQLLEE